MIHIQHGERKKIFFLLPQYKCKKNTIQEIAQVYHPFFSLGRLLLPLTGIFFFARRRMSTMQTTLTNTQRTFTLVSSEQEANFDTLKTFFSPELTLINLRRAIEKYEKNHDNLNFYRDILPSICQWASDREHSSKLVTPLAAGIEGKLQYTAKAIRYILANAFFLNTEKIADTNWNSGVRSIKTTILK